MLDDFKRVSKPPTPMRSPAPIPVVQAPERVIAEIPKLKPKQNFFKKNWIAISILATIAVLTVIIYFVIPTININKTKLVNLGAPVRIELGETVKLKTGTVSVEIINFSNVTCPQGQTCYGSAKSVEYQMTVDGQKYATGSLKPENSSDYRIETVSTDHKTYAEIKLQSNKNNVQ